MRVEISVSPTFADGRVPPLRARLARGLKADATIDLIDVYILGPGFAQVPRDTVGAVFADEVVQEIRFDGESLESRRDWELAVEVTPKPGVTDPVAITARRALSMTTGVTVSEDEIVQTARTYVFLGVTDPDSLVAELHNPLIEHATVIRREDWKAGMRFSDPYPVPGSPETPGVQTVGVSSLSDEELSSLSRTRLLALSLREMAAVRDYYNDPAVRAGRRAQALPDDPTDVELEMIAQTWSEHCRHKIFAARIVYRDEAGEEIIDGLFSTFIRAVTGVLARDRQDLLSVFHDNSGVVSFDEDYAVCFKVETHNSPSALDPYGGAITGIVGVNRDILGTGLGAFPIWNTDVLCFGLPDTAESELPAGLQHPKTILRGVHRGIVDGGNQSGIPVAAGALVFDESYRGKPLVFCGTGGLMPRTVAGRIAWEKGARPGDRAVMIGGRVGKDGIHGATFSSQALDETSPVSAVQIGDPITQRRVLDFLMEARDRGLYRSLTDNGAGGLSSSLGEMAGESGGVTVDLDACPTKYHGLAPWEIWVSESQERMSLAVGPETLDEFLALAEARDVEATAIGTFTDDGTVRLRYAGRTVGLLDLSFLETGLPTMEIPAVWIPPAERGFAEDARLPEEWNRPEELARDLLRVLAHPNVAAKEHLVRQYDHEVGGRTVLGPFCGGSGAGGTAGAGLSGPTDGAVLRPLYDSPRGITVTHGICPRYGDYDTYHMAMAAVDEAYRAHIALGGDPDRAYALDNFCWPDPVLSGETPDGEYKAAQLVRACRGLYDACLAYGIPLISGKDSMKNDARLGDRKISVRPTLLVSLMGMVEDVGRVPATHFALPDAEIYLVGKTGGELGGTIYEAVRAPAPDPAGGKGRLGPCPRVDAGRNRECYRLLADALARQLVLSVHDLSDGGLAVAAAEGVMGGAAGATILVPDDGRPARSLFCESAGRFLVSVADGDRSAFESAMGEHAEAIGRTTRDGRLVVRQGFAAIIELSREDLLEAWGSLERSLEASP